jgi:chaperonin GroEL
VPNPLVLFDERAAGALVRGYDDLAELMALTLGPTQGFVLNHREHREPELIEDSASAARRIIEMPSRAGTVGAMLIRKTAWDVHSRAGDGVATSAVLSQTILREATRYVRAGGDQTKIRRGVERGLAVALDALARQSRAVTGEEHLTRLALTITGDVEMSLILGEMLDVLGPTAHIAVEDYEAPYLERVYQDGGSWRAAIASPHLLTDRVGRRAVLENCHVVLCAGKVQSVEDVAPALALAAGGKARLLLVAHEISGKALNTLLANHDRGVVKIVAAWLRRGGEDRAHDYSDLAVVTGATVLGPEYGRLLAHVEKSDMGGAQRVEATADDLLIRGGAGDPVLRRAYVDGLRVEVSQGGGTQQDQDNRRLRLASMAGGSGVLKIGSHTRTERESRHQRAENGIRALRMAMEEGVVPGGGAAYLWAADAVRSSAESLSGDSRQGALILAQALEEPCRRIVRNRGLKVPAVALSELLQSGPGHVYDVLSDRVVSAAESGLEDSTGVLRVALEAGVSSAISALTVAVMVLRRQPWRELGRYP